jgi:hypothetical protein
LPIPTWHVGRVHDIRFIILLFITSVLAICLGNPGSFLRNGNPLDADGRFVEGAEVVVADDVGEELEVCAETEDG